ncbi:uncharacterized protein VNE69_02183 [Vairimorpha necatrix]|uniref:Uncharacterized protein n=1 Tax=Vairimorpha necatrix TaxID=6039 RepID=A0AAX4J9U5_9MICR
MSRKTPTRRLENFFYRLIKTLKSGIRSWKRFPRYRIFLQDNFLQKEEDLVNQEQGLNLSINKEKATVDEAKELIDEKKKLIVDTIKTIYSHITNFYKNKILSNTSINKLIKSYKEYAYDSEIIGLIHGILIDNLYEEESNTGLSGIITKKRI